MATLLEELYVQMTCHKDDFIKDMKLCDAQVDVTDKKLKDFAAHTKVYATEIDVVTASVGRMTDAFTAFNTWITGLNTTTLTTQIGAMAAAFATLSGSFNQLTSAFQNIQVTDLTKTVIPSLTGLSDWMQNLPRIPTATIQSLRRNIDSLRDPIDILASLPPIRLSQLQGLTTWMTELVGKVPTSTINSLADNIQKLIKDVFTPLGSVAIPVNELKELTKWVGTIKGGPTRSIDALARNITTLNAPLEALSRIRRLPIAQLDALTNWLTNLSPTTLQSLQAIDLTQTLIPSLNALSAWASGLQAGGLNTRAINLVGRLGGAIGNLPGALQALSSIGPLPIIPLQELSTWVSGLSTVPTGKVASLGRGLAGMATGIQALSASNMTMAAANMSRLLGWLNQLAAIPPSAVNTVSRLGRAMQQFAAFTKLGTNGPLPPINVANNFTAIPPAAGAAATSIGRVNDRLGTLHSRSLLAGGGLSFLRYGFLGLAGFGIAAFARMDDSLTRIMARMRIFPGMENFGPTRGFLQQGINDIASGSTTSRTDLLKGFHFLSDQLGPVQGMKALGIAEEFAVAGQLDMVESSKKLMDIYTSFGSEIKNVTGELEKMKYISDLVVGTSLAVGGTTKDLVEGLDARFLSTLKVLNMDLEQGLAFLGAYSRLGDQYRGKAGGEVAVRALQAIDKSTRERTWVGWERLGIKAEDFINQKMGISDLLTAAESKFRSQEGKGTTYSILRGMLGWERRDINAIMPLFQGAPGAMKELIENMKTLEGVSKRMADAMRHDFLGQLMILKNQLVIVATNIGEVLAPALGTVTEGLSVAFKWFSDLNPAVRSLAVWSVAAVYGLRPLAGLLLSLGARLALPFTAAASVIHGSISFVMETVWSLTSFTLRAFTATASGIHYLMMNIGTVVTDIAKSIWSALVSVVTGFLPFLINMATWFASLTITAGLFATIFVGIGQAAVGIGAAVSSAWSSLVSNVEEFSTGIVMGMHNIGDMAVNAWQRAKDGALDFYMVAKEWIKQVAGFFWNFGENIQIIFTWLAANEMTIIKDLIVMMDTAFKNIAVNFERLGSLMKDVGTSIWTMISDSFYIVFRNMFAWFKDQWGNIAADIGNIIITVISNVAINSARLVIRLPQFLAATSEGRLQYETKDYRALLMENLGRAHAVGSEGWIAGLPEVEKQVQWMKDDIVAKRRKQLLSDYLLGPFEGMPAMSTDFSSVPLRLAGTKIALGNVWGTMGEGLGKTFSSFKGLAPLLDGFKALTPAIELNLGLPGGFKGLMDTWTKKLSGGLAPASDIEGLAASGHGYREFKQISEARYMIGGPAAMTIENAQLSQLTQMNAKMQEIINLNRQLLEQRRDRSTEPANALPWTVDNGAIPVITE